MCSIKWEQFPLVAASSHPRTWLTMQANYQLALNTIVAYGRGLEGFLSFCSRVNLSYESVTREHVSLWIGELISRPVSVSGATLRPSSEVSVTPALGLSNSTIQQRLTAVRMFYDYLMEEGVRRGNPVGRGRHTQDMIRSAEEGRGILRRHKKLPWIPDDEQWLKLLEAVKGEGLRNRCMFALQYDCALRREEVCSLEIQDFDFSNRTLRIRAEISKVKRDRLVIYSEGTAEILKNYMPRRRELSNQPGRLFLSESRRNFTEPISVWTWAKSVKAIAVNADIAKFSSHSLRHLRLTDLARAKWSIQDIAKFAGHRNMNTTMLYIHLSGRELREQFARSMGSINAWREATIREGLI
jgi:integrase/recombinase XerD